MPHTPQIKIPATYMRGGTSKGVFFRLDDLPEAARVPGPARDALLLRVIGSPDPYGKQIDGMGGATSSTSKTVIVSKSTRPGHAGDFELDGVTFPAAEVQLEFMDPAAEEEGAGGAMFPTGNLVDELEVPGVGTLKATMINAGIPTIFVNADAIGYTGAELQEAINGDPRALAMFETIRAYGALRMGLIDSNEDAAKRQHTPKIAFVAKAADYVASSGKQVAAGDIDLLVRALSMGKLHHAMMGTAAVAIGTAAAIPGTLVNLAAGGGTRNAVRFGHPSGTLRVGAEAVEADGAWSVSKAIMSRSARVLMEGWVRVPGDGF